MLRFVRALAKAIFLMLIVLPIAIIAYGIATWASAGGDDRLLNWLFDAFMLGGYRKRT